MNVGDLVWTTENHVPLYNGPPTQWQFQDQTTLTWIESKRTKLGVLIEVMKTNVQLPKNPVEYCDAGKVFINGVVGWCWLDYFANVKGQITGFDTAI